MLDERNRARIDRVRPRHVLGFLGTVHHPNRPSQTRDVRRRERHAPDIEETTERQACMIRRLVMDDAVAVVAVQIVKAGPGFDVRSGRPVLESPRRHDADRPWHLQMISVRVEDVQVDVQVDRRGHVLVASDSVDGLALTTRCCVAVSPSRDTHRTAEGDRCAAGPGRRHGGRDDLRRTLRRDVRRLSGASVRHRAANCRHGGLTTARRARDGSCDNSEEQRPNSANFHGFLLQQMAMMSSVLTRWHIDTYQTEREFLGTFLPISGRFARGGELARVNASGYRTSAESFLVFALGCSLAGRSIRPFVSSKIVVGISERLDGQSDGQMGGE